MKQKVKYKGILFIVLSALCFAFMNMFVRMAGDLPAVQKSFFRNLVAFIIALATMVRHKEVFQVEKGNWKYMILRAGFGTLGILCNFYAEAVAGMFIDLFQNPDKANYARTYEYFSVNFLRSSASHVTNCSIPSPVFALIGIIIAFGLSSLT